MIVSFTEASLCRYIIVPVTDREKCRFTNPCIAFLMRKHCWLEILVLFDPEENANAVSQDGLKNHYSHPGYELNVKL